MHPKLQAVFDQHDKPTFACKRDVHDQLTPILKVASAVQKQMIEYKSLVAEAELADHDGAIDGTVEHIRQTFAAVEREANAFVEHGRGLAHALAQLDRYLAEQRKHLPVAS
jgi:hypothetical protein